MADIDNADIYDEPVDQALLSKIIDRKRKTDLRGLLRAQREGRLNEYLAKDIARAKRKMKKRSTMSTRSRSVCAVPRSTARIRTTECKVNDEKEEPQWSRKPKPSEVINERRRATSKIDCGTDYKTAAMKTFLIKEKQNNPKPKKKKLVRSWKSSNDISQSGRTRGKSHAPKVAKTSQISKKTKVKQRTPLPKKNKQVSVRRKTSTLSVVKERTRSKSCEPGPDGRSAMQIFQDMEKHNKPKPKRKRKKKIKRKSEPKGRNRIKSCVTRSKVKINNKRFDSKDKGITLFENKESEQDTQKIGSKEINLPDGAVKKASDKKETQVKKGSYLD